MSSEHEKQELRNVHHLEQDWADARDWLNEQLASHEGSMFVVELQELMQHTTMPALDGSQWDIVSQLANITLRQLVRDHRQRRREAGG